jgi:hypothetical protein
VTEKETPMSLREISCSECSWKTTVLVDDDDVVHSAPLICPQCEALELNVATVDPVWGQRVA